MGGNLKLLEDDFTQELCQIVLNNLTLIQREKVSEKGQSFKEDVLIVEHKIFFNEQYRQVYDKKNTKIMAKHDKYRQGLMHDFEVQTEFANSVLYEAYQHVYETTAYLTSNHLDLNPQQFHLVLTKGKMSGNLRLMVTHQGRLKELSMFAQDSLSSHKVCSEIVEVKDSSDINPILAYVVSLEKPFG